MKWLPAPAVSVLLPVRNGMPYVPRAVESILGQTLDDLELIVIDDGSDDGTRDYLSLVDDRRLRVLPSLGYGLADALNTGLAAAGAPYIARQDSDDWSSPQRLAEQLRWLRDRPDIDVLASEVLFADADARPIVNAWTQRVHEQWDAAVTPADIRALMPLTCCIFHATIMARMDALRNAGGYDPAMVPAEDYDLWLRMLPAADFARISQPLYTVRLHDESSSTRRKSDQIARVLAAKLRYVRRQVPSLPLHPTLALPYKDRGAEALRRVAPSEGFVTLDARRHPSTADVIAVTEFGRIEEWERRLEVVGGFRQFGNLFVRVVQRQRAA